MRIKRFNESSEFEQDVDNILNIARDEGFIVNKGNTYGYERREGYVAFSILPADEGDFEDPHALIDMCEDIEERLRNIANVKYLTIAFKEHEWFVEEDSDMEHWSVEEIRKLMRLYPKAFNKCKFSFVSCVYKA